MTTSTPALTETDLAAQVAEAVAASVRAAAGEERATSDDSDNPLVHEIEKAVKAVVGPLAVQNIESALKPAADQATPIRNTDDDTRKIVASSLLAASALTSINANAFNYAAATLPVTLSVNGEIGVAIGMEGEVGVSMSPINLGAATFGLIGSIFNIINDIIGSFMNVLDDLVPA